VELLLDPHGRGLRVPEDISIVGFDDVEHATIVTPELTMVHQPLAE
jgi:DNA-binding LacI/PurR family transcriptional regulator